MAKANQFYYPQLDSIRGLSFLAVYFFHSYHPQFGTGVLADIFKFLYGSLDYSIDVFFVLSSFLLTWLGLNEYQRNNDFSFKKYFLRRALRIWPLYFVIMIFSFILLPIVAKYMHIHITLPPASWYIFFVSNFYTPDHVYFLRFLWTLSVEEQFYLVLGVCLLLIPKHIEIMVLTFLAVSIVFNIYAATQDFNSYFNTLTYLFDFSIGSLAALLLNKNNVIVQKLRNIGTRGSIFFYACIPLLLLFFYLIQKQFTGVEAGIVGVFCRFIFILFIGLLIIEQIVNENTFFKLGKINFLVYTGKLSYGLYCFHGIALTFGAIVFTKLNITNQPLLIAALLLGANYLIATISYYYFEKPFLKLKDKLRRI